MSWIAALGKAAIGTAGIVAVITAAPVLGAVGAISGVGYGIAAVAGTAAAVADKNKEDEKDISS